MTGRDEVPPTAEVRERFIYGFPFWAVARAALGDEFDRWLAAHDEAVRAEERERIARIAKSVSPRQGAWVGEDIAARIREQGKEQGA